MLITIDTNHPTELDLKILKVALADYLVPDAPKAPQPAGESTDDGQTATPAAAPEQPKRGRRTKPEIAYDEALATYQGPHKDDGSEYAALNQAYIQLKAKDPENERVKSFEQDIPAPASEDAEEPTPDSENAESDATHEQSADSITIEQVTELATQLIQKDRSAMVDLLKQFGARRVSEIPESDLGKFASEIRAKLA
jgi:hypothetical protein